MPHSISLTPLASLRVSSHQIPAHELLPNSSLHGWPLLIYHGAFDASAGASAVESHLETVGVVKPQWRYSMYATTHFHSTTHEVLAIVRGAAQLCFGGETNGGRVEQLVHAGDLIIVPAGVAHRLIREEEVEHGMPPGTFQMVGSYPQGFVWDMCYGRENERERVEQIKTLAWFARDPLYGDEGPALREGAQKK